MRTRCGIFWCGVLCGVSAALCGVLTFRNKHLPGISKLPVRRFHPSSVRRAAPPLYGIGGGCRQHPRRGEHGRNRQTDHQNKSKPQTRRIGGARRHLYRRPEPPRHGPLGWSAPPSNSGGSAGQWSPAPLAKSAPSSPASPGPRDQRRGAALGAPSPNESLPRLPDQGEQHGSPRDEETRMRDFRHEYDYDNRSSEDRLRLVQEIHAASASACESRLLPRGGSSPTPFTSATGFNRVTRPPTKRCRRGSTSRCPRSTGAATR
jgi:hypothetical protein